MFYNIAWSFNLGFQDTCQLSSLLQTPNMPINDEHGSFTLRYVVLEFLRAMSKHISDGLWTEAQSSPFYYLMIDETTNWIFEQHLFFMLFIYQIME